MIQFLQNSSKFKVTILYTCVLLVFAIYMQEITCVFLFSPSTWLLKLAIVTNVRKLNFVFIAICWNILTALSKNLEELGAVVSNAKVYFFIIECTIIVS